MGGGSIGGGQARDVESVRRRPQCGRGLDPEVVREKETVFVPHRIMIRKEDL
jgi:hypothetical protein